MYDYREEVVLVDFDCAMCGVCIYLSEGGGRLHFALRSGRLLNNPLLSGVSQPPRPPLPPPRRFVLGASNVCMVGDKPTRSVPAW